MNVNYEGSQVMASASKAKSVGQIEEDCAKLDATISMVENELAGLRGKLGPVIVTSPTSIGSAGHIVSPEAMRCDLADKINSFSRRIGSIGNEIMSLSNNIQL